MAKGFGSRLKHLDLSALASKLSRHSNDCLDVIGYKCPNLETLNLSSMNISNKPFGKMIKYLKHIRDVNISNCYRINDVGLIRMFQRCSELSSVNLSFCQAVTGTCFHSCIGKLESVTLDGCSVK